MANKSISVLTDGTSISSGCLDGEEDSESVWGSASECRSDISNEEASSAESISQELPTVRDKPDEEESEIQKLIAAAETLALERAMYIQSRASKAEEGSCSSVPFNETSTSTRETDNKQIESPLQREERKKQKKVEKGSSVDSGYFDKGDSHVDMQQHIDNANVRILVSNDSDESCIHASKCINDNGMKLPKGNLAPQVSRDHVTSKENVEMEKKRYSNSMSVLPLEPANSVSKNRVGQEERLPVTKDVKEVCNSSIRESSVEVPAAGPLPCQTMPVTDQEELLQKQEYYYDSRELSSTMHEECSHLLSLALDSNSCLGRVLRLLRQVTSLQLRFETPHVAEGVLQELNEYELHQKSMENQLSTAAARLQVAMGKIQEAEVILGEQQQEAARVDQCASRLLAQVENGLSANDLEHMAAVMSPRRRSTTRTLEETASALALLLGELQRKALQVQSMEEELKRHGDEIESLREKQLQGDIRFRTAEVELMQVRERGSAETTSLRQCLAQAEDSLNESRSENLRIIENYKKQVADNKIVIEKLQHQLCDVQRSSDVRVSQLERSLHDVTNEKESLESTVAELKDQLSVKAQQINLSEEENTLLVEGLRSTMKHQQGELEQMRQQLDSATTKKHNFSVRLSELENELSQKEEQYEELCSEMSSLKENIRTLKLENSDTHKHLQGKIDDEMSVRCDLQREIRSRDLIALQTKTELQMEKHRCAALTEENDNLMKKVHTLQERISAMARRRRYNSGESSRSIDDNRTLGSSGMMREMTSVCSSSTLSLNPSPPADAIGLQMKTLVKDIDEGQMREEQLHALLREKDAAISNLQETLSSQIAAKNQELENVTSKVSQLEDQMGSLLSGLEVSAAIGNVTTEVGRLLQERSERLRSIDHSSHWLQGELSSLAEENQTLSDELSNAKRRQINTVTEAQESARKARQEAREERLAATRMQEKCLRLQAQLEYAQATLEQERQEKLIREAVLVIKQREFGSLLDNMTSSSSQQDLNTQ